MYIVLVVLLLGVLPAGSVFAEHSVFHSAASIPFLMGKWFTFWAVGVRLGLAGLRQSFQPQFTARRIFNIQSDDMLPIVQELGLANIAMGTLGLVSLAVPAMILPAAMVGGLYYGLAGLLHVRRSEKNFYERFAMLSDLFIFGVLAFCVAAITAPR